MQSLMFLIDSRSCRCADARVLPVNFALGCTADNMIVVTLELVGIAQGYGFIKYVAHLSSAGPLHMLLSNI